MIVSLTAAQTGDDQWKWVQKGANFPAVTEGQIIAGGNPVPDSWGICGEGCSKCPEPKPEPKPCPVPPVTPCKDCEKTINIDKSTTSIDNSQSTTSIDNSQSTTSIDNSKEINKWFDDHRVTDSNNDYSVKDSYNPITTFITNEGSKYETNNYYTDDHSVHVYNPVTNNYETIEITKIIQITVNNPPGTTTTNGGNGGSGDGGDVIYSKKSLFFNLDTTKPANVILREYILCVDNVSQLATDCTGLGQNDVTITIELENIGGKIDDISGWSFIVSDDGIPSHSGTRVSPDFASGKQIAAGATGFIIGHAKVGQVVQLVKANPDGSISEAVPGNSVTITKESRERDHKTGNWVHTDDTASDVRQRAGTNAVLNRQLQASGEPTEWLKAIGASMFGAWDEQAQFKLPPYIGNWQGAAHGAEA